MDKEEYKICKVRGHVSDGTGLTVGYGPTQLKCKYCGIRYYYTEPEPELVELWGQN